MRVGAAEPSTCVVRITQIAGVVGHGHDEAVYWRGPRTSKGQGADSGEHPSDPGCTYDVDGQAGQGVEPVPDTLYVAAPPSVASSCRVHPALSSSRLCASPWWRERMMVATR
nr:hypothetical protein [Frigoribacterium sp. PvP032]